MLLLGLGLSLNSHGPGGGSFPRAIATWGNSIAEYYTSGNGGPSLSSRWSPAMTVYNGGVGGDEVADILARFNAADSANRQAANVIGDIWQNGATAEAKAACVSMAATLEAAGNTRYLIFNRWINGTANWYAGTAGRIEADAQNDDLAATFGVHYFNISQVLIETAAPGGIYEDATWYARQVPPPQTTEADRIHENLAGIDIMQPAVKNRLAALGYVSA